MSLVVSSSRILYKKVIRGEKDQDDYVYSFLTKSGARLVFERVADIAFAEGLATGSLMPTCDDDETSFGTSGESSIEFDIWSSVNSCIEEGAVFAKNDDKSAFAGIFFPKRKAGKSVPTPDIPKAPGFSIELPFSFLKACWSLFGEIGRL